MLTKNRPEKKVDSTLSISVLWIAHACVSPHEVEISRNKQLSHHSETDSRGYSCRHSAVIFSFEAAA